MVFFLKKKIDSYKYRQGNKNQKKMSLSRVLLECYGTANFAMLETVFDPIRMHLDVWAKASFTKQHFVHHGVTMFYLMDALCNQMDFQVVETVFHRLEFEEVIEPCGVFETLLLLIMIGRCVHSYRDMVALVRSCETAKQEQDIYVGRCSQAHFLLPRLEYARTLVIYNFAYDVLVLVFAKPKPRPAHLRQDRKEQPRRELKTRQPKLLFKICLRVVLFCVKMRRRRKAHQGGAPTLRSVVIATVFASRLKNRMRQTRIRMQRKLRKQVRKEALLKEKQQMMFVRNVMTRTVLPSLVSLINHRKKTSAEQKQQSWNWNVLVTVIRSVVRFKRKRPCMNAVKFHMSAQTYETLIRYWKKLGKLHRIRKALMADRRVMDALPLKLIQVREKILKGKVETFLFAQPGTRGNRIYWEFRFAIHLLRLMHESFLRICLHLQTRANMDILPRCVLQYSALMNVVLNPFVKSNEITMSVIEQNNIQPMIILLNDLRKGKFIKQLERWMHKDPVLQCYDTCLSFFVLTVDIFTNLETCFQKIPFAHDRVLYALYHTGSNHFNMEGITVFYNCTKHYPRFDGLFELFKQRSISNFIDCWLHDSYASDLVEFLKLIEQSKLFVDTIEQDKHTNTKRKKKKLTTITVTTSRIELQEKFLLRKDALRHK